MLKRTRLKIFWGGMLSIAIISIGVVFFLIQSEKLTPVEQVRKVTHLAIGIAVTGCVFGVVASRLVFQIMKPGGSRQFEAPSFSDEENDSGYESPISSERGKQTRAMQKTRDPEKMALIDEMKTKMLGSDRLAVLESSIDRIKHATKDEVDEILALFQSQAHADTAKALLEPKIGADEAPVPRTSKKTAKKKAKKKH